MPTVTASPYGAFALQLLQGNFNVSTDSFKVMLATSGYVPNVDTDSLVSTVTPNQVTGGTYTAGGVSLSNLTLSYDAVNKRCVLTADPAVWTAATFTGAHYAVVYRPSDGKLVGFIDFGEDKSPAAQDFQVTFTSGLLRLRLA